MSNGRNRGGDHSLFTSTGKPAPSFGTGRVCAEDMCATRLSIYNGTMFCSLHARPGDGKVNNVLRAR
jgi:hypothetical protein